MWSSSSSLSILGSPNEEVLHILVLLRAVGWQSRFLLIYAVENEATLLLLLSVWSTMPATAPSHTSTTILLVHYGIYFLPKTNQYLQSGPSNDGTVIDEPFEAADLQHRRDNQCE